MSYKNRFLTHFGPPNFPHLDSPLKITFIRLILIWDFTTLFTLTSVGGRWQLPRRMKSHRGMKNLDTQGAWAKLPSSLDCSCWNNLTAFSPCLPWPTVVAIEIWELDRWSLVQYFATMFSTIWNWAEKLGKLRKKMRGAVLINLEVRKFPFAVKSELWPQTKCYRSALNLCTYTIYH